MNKINWNQIWKELNEWIDKRDIDFEDNWPATKHKIRQLVEKQLAKLNKIPLIKGGQGRKAEDTLLDVKFILALSILGIVCGILSLIFHILK